MSRALDAFSDRAIGARIVSVDEVGPYEAYVELEHRGTDDDTFRVAIDVREIEWRDPSTGEFARASNSHSGPQPNEEER